MALAPRYGNLYKIPPFFVVTVFLLKFHPKVGDFIELNLLESIFFEKRKEPLKIGSVKSNIGHTESVSALCSIIKVILSFENNVILPNIHFRNFPSYVETLKVGKFNVSVENLVKFSPKR